MNMFKFKGAYILSFLIPVFFLNIIFLISGIFPFGNLSLLQGDLNFQYISYLSYFRDSILSGQFNNFLYSFSMSIGNTMSGLDTYYLLNPLFIILLFFKSSNLTVAIYFITNLLIGIIGAAMFFYCTHTKRVQLSLGFSMIFSLSYALMSYTIVYMSNIMWLPGVALLPLIGYGIEVLLSEGKGKLYFFSLALAILFNFYIGYMLCIFSLLFFVYNWLVLNRLTLNRLKLTLPIIGKYIYLSISSVLINMIFLLPTISATALSKSSHTPTDFSFHSLINPFLVIRSLLTINNVQSGLPNIYCGLFICLLAIHYFLSNGVNLREKLLSCSLLTAIYLGLQFQTLSVIWHVFKSPLGFPHRFSFIMSFMLIYLAMVSTKNMTQVKKSKIYLIKLFSVLTVTILVTILSLYYANIHTSTKSLLLSITFIAFYLVLLHIVFQKKDFLRKTAFVIIIAMLGTELFLTGQRSYTTADKNFNQNEYSTYVSENQKIIKSIQQNDPTFYRVEKNYMRDSAAFNDSMLLNYRGISHYSSSLDFNTRMALMNLGYTSFDSIWPSWINYNNGSTVASDTLLGIKYFISHNKQSDTGSIAYFNDVSYSNSTTTLYKNPFFLGMGITASDKLFHISSSQNNLFKYQNSIWTAFAKKDVRPVFKPVDFKKKFHNLAIIDGQLHKIDSQKQSYIDLSYIYNNNPIYLYIENSTKYIGLSEQFQVVQEHSQMNYPTYSNDGIIPLENNYSNRRVHFKLIFNDPMDSPIIDLYQLDTKTFSSLVNDLRKNTLHISKYSNTYIEAEVNSERNKDNLFLSIPYDNNWKISVNDKQVTAKKALRNFITIPLEEGENHIVMTYTNSTLLYGAIISIAYILLLCIVWFTRKRKTSKNTVITAR